MPLTHLGLELQPLPGPLPAWLAVVDPHQWTATAGRIAAAGGRLVSLWGTERQGNDGSTARAICAALANDAGLLWLELPLTSGVSYPDLTPTFACAERLQRAAADLSGLHAEGARDRRPWLDHGLWGDGGPPLRTDVGPGPPRSLRSLPPEWASLLWGGPAGGPAGAAPRTLPAGYDFVLVEGDGVHEIAVGPVHAGIIEPGHFRFSVVGEKVLRLEERLGYTHKGIEHRFTTLPAQEAFRLAGRISGDSTVAFGWAFAMALEGAAGCDIPERAAWLRALLLERERVANHLGDLGALGNDAALAFGLAQFSRLREDWQRRSKQVFGHRLLMDVIVPGGVARDIDLAARDALRRQCDDIEREVRTLRGIYDEHAGLQDRFMTTGRVPRELALRLGLTGLAARASGVAQDMRAHPSLEPYRGLVPRVCVQGGGDVAARVAVRFDELFESLRLIRELCARLPMGAAIAEWQWPEEHRRGIGWVEGWRGEVMIALELAPGGRIQRCHPHDPSWQNWPVLEHAVIGNIVPDFPLINKSFNLSYSGHDL